LHKTRPWLFFPESLQTLTAIGRSSDLLRFYTAFPTAGKRSVAKEVQNWLKELTAAGTVADLHGIPYYPQDKIHFGTICLTNVIHYFIWKNDFVYFFT
jgi:hypothetical protein